MSSAMMPFEITGPESPHPIVLVPGGLSGWVSWKPHSEVLAKRYRVIRVQLLNMAAAENQQTPGAGYTLRSESEALKKTLDSLNVETMHLVGWSHGGAVSLDYALDNPVQVKTLTLIEPAAYWVGRAYGKFGEDERQMKELFYGFHMPPTEEDLIGFLKWNQLVPPGTDPRSMARWPVWNKLRMALLSLHTVIEHGDDPNRLKTLRGKPVLLVRGEESTGANSGIIDLIAEALGPGTRILSLPDGHACHIVAQDKFIAELTQFISAAKS